MKGRTIMRKNRIRGIALVMALVLALGALCGCQSKGGKGKSNYYNENFGFENGATECGGLLEIDKYNDEFVFVFGSSGGLFSEASEVEACVNIYTDGNYLEKNFKTIEQLIGGNHASAVSGTYTVIDNDIARVNSSGFELTVTFAERKILGNNKMVIEGAVSSLSGSSHSYSWVPVSLLDMEKAEPIPDDSSRGAQIPWKY